jgi:hypothetical protein
MRLAAFEMNLDVPASGTPKSNAKSGGAASVFKLFASPKFSGKFRDSRLPAPILCRPVLTLHSYTLSTGEFSPPSGPGSANRPLPNRPADKIAPAEVLGKTCVEVVNLDDRHDENSNPIDLEVVQEDQSNILTFIVIPKLSSTSLFVIFCKC